MNLLFLTQGRTLRLFYDTATAMRTATEVGDVGFYVTDSAYFRGFVADRPDFTDDGRVLKEWEVLARAAVRKPDLERLEGYERRLADPVLWNAIVADRRLYLGPGSVREQDYASRFDHETLLAIVQTLIEDLGALFDRLRPDAVVGFICVTAAEYLAHLIARERDIPFLDLRPTRIRNYFYAGESVQEPSLQVEAVYRAYRGRGIPAESRETAMAILASIRERHAMYEGVLPASGGAVTVPKPAAALRDGFAVRLSRSLYTTWRDRRGPYRFDTHRQSRVAVHWFQRVRKPLRLRRMDRALRRRYATSETLRHLRYAFFPLHKEPEVTLLVYGRPFLNQIEVVRHIARSLPVGMKLVVKEHPAAIGYRPLGYYLKLLAIPNVVLAAPELTSREVLDRAQLVAIIGGSVGLEAAMLGRPVIAFGRVPFSCLPETMFRTAGAPDALAEEIRVLLDGYRHDEEAILAYVAAVVASSVPVDFYSVLIGRTGVYRPDGAATGEYRVQVARLADYLIACWRARRAATAGQFASAGGR
jgi:hypothetical protein